MDELISQLEKYTSISPKGHKAFDEYLKEKFDEYCELPILNTLLIPTEREVIEDLCDRILRAVRMALNGFPHKAFPELWNGLKMNLYTKSIRSFRSFYRMRIVEDKRGVDVDDLFHIPFTKQGIVKTQRYSVPGLPCLYLGLSLYGCWEELGRPAINTCLFSRFQNNQDFTVLDFRPPSLGAGEDEKRNFLLIMPLIIACSIRVQNEMDFFKPEYIVPQLVLEAIPEINKCNAKTDKSKTIGIGYRSVCQNSEFGFTRDKFDNIVIPAHRNGDKFDQELCNLFRLTKPTCEEYERIRHWNVIFDGGDFDNFDNNNFGDNYTNTAFGQLESYISDESIFPLQNVVNDDV